MGNCTSKKSAKSFKLNSKLKTNITIQKMNRHQEIHSKGISKKVVPCTKGEITSFGFKKKSSSQLPFPVTLTSNNETVDNITKKFGQNEGVIQRNLSEGYQSGSSVESLHHAPFRSTPKITSKSQAASHNSDSYSVNGNSVKSNKISKATEVSSTSIPCIEWKGAFAHYPNRSESQVNRFGFRETTLTRSFETDGKAPKHKATPISRLTLLTDQGPRDTSAYKLAGSAKSRTMEIREAFFKQPLNSSNFVQSELNELKASQTNMGKTGKFTFQSTHLPRPQFPLRMTDAKMAKTAANYSRRSGVRDDPVPLNEGSYNEDSGFDSHSSADNTIDKKTGILESSPGCRVRRRLPTFKGKKLEMKVIGNKFELLKKDEKTSNVVTKISLVQLPVYNARTSTAVINTGLVLERTNEYLKKVSQTYNCKKGFDEDPKDPNKTSCRSEIGQTRERIRPCECLDTESEEEKLCKDSRRSEKYLLADGCEETDYLMPGEAMADEENLCLSFEGDLSGVCSKVVEGKRFTPEMDVTPNTIRLDALKLSKQLKHKNPRVNENNIYKNDKNSNCRALMRDETFLDDSILEQLSSDSDSLGDKGENKNNDKEKNLKRSKTNSEEENSEEIDVSEYDTNKSDTDVDDNEIELNMDDTPVKEGRNNCLGSPCPDSRGSPIHGSHSLSITDERDFLIDDEIADQPQLCFSEKHVDKSGQDEVNTLNEKSVISLKISAANFEAKTSMGTVNCEKRSRLNSQGTLSPCESITSDDLMLDFEPNSFDEPGERLVNAKYHISLENQIADSIARNDDEIPGQVATAKSLTDAESSGTLGETKNGRGGCSTPTSIKSLEVISCKVFSPPPCKSNVLGENFVNLDKISYEIIFEDVISMKAMLLRLKHLLSGTEGSLQEKQRFRADYKDEVTEKFIEDELMDLRRQVLFLQQQLEEREKTVQVLKLEINKNSENLGSSRTTVKSRAKKQCNAATQTGCLVF